MPKPSPIEGTTTADGPLDRGLDRAHLAEEADGVADAELVRERASAPARAGRGRRCRARGRAARRRASANARSRTMCPLIGIRRPTQSSRRPRAAEPAAARRPGRSRSGRCRSSRRRSPRPPRGSARARARSRCGRGRGSRPPGRRDRSTASPGTQLKPCFVEKRTGTRTAAPASSPYASAWTRCVCRIAGRVAHEVRDEPDERDRVDVGAQRDRVERHAARAQRLARTPRRPARARAASASARPSRARAAAAAARAGAPPSRRCRRPSADGGSRPGFIVLRQPRGSRPAQVSTECCRDTRSRSSRPSACRSSSPSAASASIRSANVSGRLALERERRLEPANSVSNASCEASTGTAGRSTPRARSCRATDRKSLTPRRPPRRSIGGSSVRGLRPSRPWRSRGIALARHELLELAACSRSSERRAGRPVEVDAARRRRARARCRTPSHHLVEPLRPRVAAERHDARTTGRPAAVRGWHGNSSRSIPCPIAVHLPRAQRERAHVEAEHVRADEPLGERGGRRAPSSACTRASAARAGRGRTAPRATV